MINLQNEWKNSEPAAFTKFLERLNKKNMRWSSLIGSYYGRPFTRHQFFTIRNIDKNNYVRDIPAKYEEDYGTDKDGLALMPFLDLIKHENFDSQDKKPLIEMIPEELF